MKTVIKEDQLGKNDSRQNTDQVAQHVVEPQVDHHVDGRKAAPRRLSVRIEDRPLIRGLAASPGSHVVVADSSEGGGKFAADRVKDKRFPATIGAHEGYPATGRLRDTPQQVERVLRQ